jgi:hypothetical protein
MHALSSLGQQLCLLGSDIIFSSLKSSREDAPWAFEERGRNSCRTFGCYFKSISSCSVPESQLLNAPHIGEAASDAAAVVVVDKVRRPGTIVAQTILLNYFHYVYVHKGR